MSPTPLTLGITPKGLERQLEAMPAEAKAAAIRALKKGAQHLRTKWARRLSGPRGPRRLGVVTGTLRRSLTVSRIERGAHGPEIKVGSPMPYAAVHEWGFNGRVNVRAHVRNGAGVKAYTRNMRIPERPHARPAMKDATPGVRRIFAKQMQVAIKNSLAEGRGA